MQVALVGVPPLKDSAYFRRVLYGFVVFSIVSVAVVLGFVGIIFFIIFFFNMAAAISHDKKERREREKLAHDRKNQWCNWSGWSRI
jgi:uncharacterized membrane protein